MSVPREPGSWSYRPGAWFGIVGDHAVVILPPSEKSRVAALWELVDDGAGFDVTLDALISSGLRELPGFVLVSTTDGGETKVVLRGEARASFTVGGETVELAGGSATTWVERTLHHVERMSIAVEDVADDVASYPIEGGLVRISLLEEGVVPEPSYGGATALVTGQPAGARSATPPPPPLLLPPPPPPPVAEEPHVEEHGSEAHGSEAHGLAEEDAAAEHAEVPPVPAGQLDALFGPVGDLPDHDHEPAPEPHEDALEEQPGEAQPGATATTPGADEPAPTGAPPSWTPPPPPPHVPAPPSLPPGIPPPPAAPPGAPPHLPPGIPPPPSGPPPVPEVAAHEVRADEVPTGVMPSMDHDGLTEIGGRWDPDDLPAPPGIPGQPMAPPVTARPVARMVLSTGESVDVDRVVLVGRAPEARRFAADEQPRLVTVPSAHQEISSTHLEIRPGSGADHGSAVVTDLGSTNGTVVVQPGFGAEDLKPGVSVQLIPGAVIDLGDGVTIQITHP